MNEIIPTLQTVTLSLDSGIARITLNRPDKLNALNDEMWRELREAFAWADRTPAARVVVLSGNGRAFSTGIDLAMLAGLRERIRHADLARSQELLRALILDLQDCVSSIERCRKPVMAAIHGPCIGGAVDIISACDMRYASANAIFSVREIDIGMAADVGTLQRLPRIIPDGIARELAYTGRNVLAEEAKEFGLVNRVIRPREPRVRHARSVARRRGRSGRGGRSKVAAGDPRREGNAQLRTRPFGRGWPALRRHLERVGTALRRPARKRRGDDAEARPQLPGLAQKIDARRPA